MNIFSTWLTVNRACNLSCKWCYAQETDKNCNMELDIAKQLINISTDNGIKNFKLIGGEPTIYPFFWDVIEYIIKANASITIITNGVKLAEDTFCNRLKDYNYPKLHMGISLKGSTNEDYLRDCGSKSYSKVLTGIKNCDKYNLSYSLSYVLTHENIGTLDIFANNIKSSGITKPIFMAYCNSVISEDENTETELQIKMDYEFSKKYEAVNDILDNKLKIHQTFPLCMCEPITYIKMLEKGQVNTTCHVHKRNGLIFDTDGSILLCNHLAGYGIGQYGIDFYDAETFKQYWESDYVINLYKKFTTIPSEECQNCELISKCGGGCFIQWFTQHFEEYKKYYKSKTEGIST